MKMITVYCPKGCNITEAPIDNPTDQCGACGAIMTADYESYDDTHERLERYEISKFEESMMKNRNVKDGC